MKKLMDEFDAVSEDGKHFHILVYVKEIDVRSMDKGNEAPLEGLKEVVTSEGYRCNFIDDNTFEIVPLGIKVKRIR